MPPEDFDEDELSTETRLLLQDEAAPSTEPITGIPIGVVPPRFSEGEDGATTGSAAQTGVDTQPDDLLSGRFAADASEPPAPHVIDDMRQALLSAIAGYPDEIVVAVLEVAQDPERLAASEPGRVAPPDPPIDSGSSTLEVERAEVFEESFANLEEHPELLATLKQYPHATEALGEFTRENLSETWRIIDEERAEIPPEEAAADSAPRVKPATAEGSEPKS